jgi:GTPase SAR1 family protein
LVVVEEDLAARLRVLLVANLGDLVVEEEGQEVLLDQELQVKEMEVELEEVLPPSAAAAVVEQELRDQMHLGQQQVLVAWAYKLLVVI